MNVILISKVKRLFLIEWLYRSSQLYGLLSLEWLTNSFWAHRPISFKNMMLFCVLFLDPHLTTHHSNIGVYLIWVTESGPLTLLSYDLGNACIRLPSPGALSLSYLRICGLFGQQMSTYVHWSLVYWKSSQGWRVLSRVLSLCIWYLILVSNMAHEVGIAGVEVIFSLMMQINFRIGASNFMYHYPILLLHWDCPSMLEARWVSECECRNAVDCSIGSLSWNWFFSRIMMLSDSAYIWFSGVQFDYGRRVQKQDLMRQWRLTCA